MRSHATPRTSLPRWPCSNIVPSNTYRRSDTSRSELTLPSLYVESGRNMIIQEGELTQQEHSWYRYQPWVQHTACTFVRSEPLPVTLRRTILTGLRTVRTFHKMAELDNALSRRCRCCQRPGPARRGAMMCLTRTRWAFRRWERLGDGASARKQCCECKEQGHRKGLRVVGHICGRV